MRDVSLRERSTEMFDKRIILFHRSYQQFQGGHLKVWNYFNHVMDSPHYRPLIRFSDCSVWDTNNPWAGVRRFVIGANEAVLADTLFIAGMDWLMLKEEERMASTIPVINLIQHVRHADPREQLSSFLRYKAVRICVSQDVAMALEATGRTNGPLFVIPNGIDTTEIPVLHPHVSVGCDILIDAVKNPELGMKLLRSLAPLGLKAEVISSRLARANYLNRISRSKITIFLPHVTEGFYLPALEGMATGTLVICPDCVGNRSFCRDGINCFNPSYTFDEIIASVRAALLLGPSDMEQIKNNARQTVSQHDISSERAAFLDILDHIDHLWRGMN